MSVEARGDSDARAGIAAETRLAPPGGGSVFTAAEVREHSTRESAWVVLHGQVWDLTDFIDVHPGGDATILAAAGKNVTVFWSAIHKKEWLEKHLQPNWLLGALDMSDGAEELKAHSALAPKAAKIGGDVAYSKTEDPLQLKKRQWRTKPIDFGLTCQLVDTMVLLESNPGRKQTLMERMVSLVEIRGNPNCTDQEEGGGSSPLMIAAMLGSDEHVQRLLVSNADPLQTTNLQVSVLHKFAARPMPDASAPAVLDLLLDAQCNVNATMKQGRTPLHVAAQWGQADMCRLLLEKGALQRARAGMDGIPADWARTCVLDKTKLAAVLRVLQA